MSKKIIQFIIILFSDNKKLLGLYTKTISDDDNCYIDDGEGNYDIKFCDRCGTKLIPTNTAKSDANVPLA